MLRKFARASLSSLQYYTHGTKRTASSGDVILGSWVLKPQDLVPGFLYVATRAISNRVNENGDGWPKDQLGQSYQTFQRRGVYVDHHNHDFKRSRGVIKDSRIHHVEDDTNPEGTDTWVELLIEVDAERFPKLAKAILNGDLDSVSMGADVEYSVCSICGNKAHHIGEFCEHIPYLKNSYVDGKLCYEDLYGIVFFEISFVFNPADPTAVFGPDDVHLASEHTFGSITTPLRYERQSTLARVASDTFQTGESAYGEYSTSEEVRGQASPPTNFRVDLGEGVTAGPFLNLQEATEKLKTNTFNVIMGDGSVVKFETGADGRAIESRLADKEIGSLPESVDTLREESDCPVCGMEMDGNECDHCGYTLPPEGFQDPNTDPTLGDEVLQQGQEDAREELLDQRTAGEQLTILGPNLPTVEMQRKGQFHVHRAGCQDLNRGPAKNAPRMTGEFETQSDVVAEIYADFIQSDDQIPDYLDEVYFHNCTSGLRVAAGPEEESIEREIDEAEEESALDQLGDGLREDQGFEPPRTSTEHRNSSRRNHMTSKISPRAQARARILAARQKTAGLDFEQVTGFSNPAPEDGDSWQAYEDDGTWDITLINGKYQAGVFPEGSAWGAEMIGSYDSLEEAKQACESYTIGSQDTTHVGPPMMEGYEGSRRDPKIRAKSRARVRSRAKARARRLAAQRDNETDKNTDVTNLDDTLDDPGPDETVQLDQATPVTDSDEGVVNEVDVETDTAPTPLPASEFSSEVNDGTSSGFDGQNDDTPAFAEDGLASSSSVSIVEALNLVEEREALGLSQREARTAEVARFEQMDRREFLGQKTVIQELTTKIPTGRGRVASASRRPPLGRRGSTTNPSASRQGSNSQDDVIAFL